MLFLATRPIAAGEELLHSYGERANADFLLNYGFLPPRNCHDAVVVFPNLEEAVSWATTEFPPKVCTSHVCVSCHLF
jgi:hypothetical protein